MEKLVNDSQTLNLKPTSTLDIPSSDVDHGYIANVDQLEGLDFDSEKCMTLVSKMASVITETEDIFLLLIQLFCQHVLDDIYFVRL